MNYQESVVQFGQGQGMLGVLTQPTEVADQKICLIMLNAGLLHRVGPFRMHVQLARQLVGRGISSFRLDLSGLGDSAPRRSGKSVQHNAIEDVRDAMTLLQSRCGIEHFVIMGLCSGAENAHHIGLAIPSVSGLVFIDGILHKTRRYYLSHYLPRIFSLSKWRDWLLRRALLFSKKNREAAKLLSAASDIWDVPSPPEEEVSEQLQTIVDNSTKLLSIYTGGLGHCSYEDQMRDAYAAVDFKDQLTTSLQIDADHTFSLAAHRTRLFDLIENWLTTNFINSGHNSSNPTDR